VVDTEIPALTYKFDSASTPRGSQIYPCIHQETIESKHIPSTHQEVATMTMMPRFPQLEVFQSKHPQRTVTPTNQEKDHGHGIQSVESSEDLSPETRSKSIPITRRLKRTVSEIQLDEEEALADFRDYAMFTRIVEGISKAQQQTRDCRWRHANDVSLQHVFKARNEEHIGTLNQTRGFAEKLQAYGRPTPTPSLVGMMANVHQDEEPMFPLEL
jgi:hypothetical protein